MINGTYRDKISYTESPQALIKIAKNCMKWRHTYYTTCGSGALSALTGLSPKSIDKCRPKSNINWTDLSIRKFLKGRGFAVQTVSKYGVTAIDPLGNWEHNPIKNTHVLLLNSLVCKGEATWAIATGNYLFHNLDYQPLDPLSFVNKPTQSVYLVSHKNWR